MHACYGGGALNCVHEYNIQYAFLYRNYSLKVRKIKIPRLESLDILPMFIYINIYIATSILVKQKAIKCN